MAMKEKQGWVYIVSYRTHKPRLVSVGCPKNKKEVIKVVFQILKLDSRPGLTGPVRGRPVPHGTRISSTARSGA